MFRVLAPVVITPSAEARHALGAELRNAALAAWRAIARRGEGIEMAHLQIVHAGVTLAVCSQLRRDGLIAIEIGLGDPALAARVIPMARLRSDAARALPRRSVRF